MKQQRIDWSKWDHLLGVETDTEIAKKAGCDQSTVWYRRDKLGIEKPNVRVIDWAKWDRFLGKEPDSKVAKRIGCSAGTVFLTRHDLGILSTKERIDWPKWDHLIGTETDKDVAKIIGCRPNTVTVRRLKSRVSAVQLRGWNRVNGLAGVVAPAPVENTPEMREALKGLDPRTRDVIARRYGLKTNPETLEEIGNDYGRTRERIRQLEKKGLQRLRFLLTRTGIQGSNHSGVCDGV